MPPGVWGKRLVSGELAPDVLVQSQGLKVRNSAPGTGLFGAAKETPQTGGVQKEKRPPQGGLMLEQWKYQQIWQAIWCWDISRISFSGGS